MNIKSNRIHQNKSVQKVKIIIFQHLSHYFALNIISVRENKKLWHEYENVVRLILIFQLKEEEK